MKAFLNLNWIDNKKITKIGKGQYGKVYKIENKSTHKKYAAKINNINNATDQSDEKDPKNSINTQKITADQFMNEVKILSKVNYPTVVHFIGYSRTDFRGKNNPTIVTDFIPNSSLQKMLEDEVKSQAPTEWTGTSRYIALFGISLGMHHLRKLNIIHRDLKPDNILLNESYYPVICDFGFSKIAAGDLTEFVTGTNLGTPSYKAPEIGKRSYNFKVDVFSFSIIAYQLMFCKTTNFDFDVSLINGVDVRIFFEKCHSEDPLMRPDFYDICCFITRSDFVENFDEIEIDKMIDFFEFLEDKEPDLDADTLLFIGLFYLENGNGDYLNEAADYFQKSINKGNRDAMYKYAEILHEGNGIDEDKKRAAELFKKSADLGQPDSMYSYSEMLLKGEGVKADKEEAKKYLMKSVKLFQPEAMFKYAEMLYNGDGVKADKKEAAKYFKMSADTGKPEAIFKYANIAYEGDGIEADKKQAAQYFQSSADRGNEEAMLKFATMSYVGDGIKINKEQAAEYFRLLANRDNVNAMLKFATMKYEGDGIKVNKKEASKYFKKAANKDNQEAMYKYALMVYEGDGIDVDKNLAIEYFKKAMDKNHPEAMYKYAMMLYEGDKTAADKKQAAEYFKKYGEKGNQEGNYKYAMMLYEGDGIKADKNQATKYFKELAEKGHLESFYQYKLMILKKEAARVVFDETLYPSLKIEDLNDQSLLMYKYGHLLLNGINGAYKDLFKVGRGIVFMQKAAELDQADAMYEYAMMLYEGEIIAANKKQAVEYFKKAAKKKHREAMYKYAMMCYEGDGIAANKKQAAKYFEMLSKMGNPEVIYKYAMMLYEGDGIAANKKQAAEYFKKSAEKGQLESLYQYTLMTFQKEAAPVDFDKSLFPSLRIEDLNDQSLLKYKYGLCLINSRNGSYKDYFNHKRGINFLKESADEGNADAMYKYSMMLHDEASPITFESLDLDFKAFLNLNLNDYKKINEIGRGQYRKVYKIESKTTHKNYAAKVNSHYNATKGQFLNEVDILSKVNYPTVEHFIGYSLTDFKGNNNPTIVTDFIPNSSLQKMLEDEVKCQAPIEWTGTSRYIALFGISLGMHHLRKLNIIHHDLKPDNILLNEFYYPVICDFGFSKIAAEYLTEFVTSINLGTPSSYKAPEIGRWSYNFKVDVFSFSIIAYQLMFCKTTNFDFDVSLINGVDVRLFLEKCHSKDPLMRPDFYDICCFITRSDFVENFDVIEIDKMIDFFEFLENKEPDLDADTLLFIGLFYLENGNGDYLNKAADYLQKSSDKGSRDAMFKYAEMLHEGNGIASDIKRAAELFKKSADLGQPYSMYSYSEMLLKGEGVKADKEEAEKYLMKSVELHQPEAMLEYAEMLYNGDGVKAYKKEAAKYFEMLAKMGNPGAMHKYAMMLYEGDGITLDKKQAAQYFQSSADRGNEEAMLKFATMSYVGDGININKEQAAEYFQLLANRDNVNAMLKFATMKYEGDGIKVNKKEASIYFKKAANKDNQEAMYKYALMVYEGDGIDVDKKLAIKYFKKAMDKNHPEAMYKYAVMLYDGDGITADKKQAAEYFKKYGEKGNQGKYKYAMMLYEGDGIKADKNQATKYFKELAEKGHLESLYQYALMIFKKEAAPVDFDESLFPSLRIEDLNDQSLLMYKYGHLLLNSINGAYKDLFKVGRGIVFMQKAAELEQADAMYEYAMMLYEGEIIAVNKKQAVEYFKKAAEKKHREAMYKYAMMLYEGDGMIANKKQAAEYFKESAEKGQLESLYQYTLMTFQKEAAPVDFDKSLFPSLRIEDLNDQSLLKYKYGLCLINSRNGSYKDYFNHKRGINFLKESADEGNADAMYKYSMMLHDGDGIAADKKQSAEYFQKAEEKRNQKSIILNKGEGQSKSFQQNMPMVKNDEASPITFESLDLDFNAKIDNIQPEKFLLEIKRLKDQIQSKSKEIQKMREELEIKELKINEMKLELSNKTKQIDELESLHKKKVEQKKLKF